jgi:hypothetical protein
MPRERLDDLLAHHKLLLEDVPGDEAELLR